MLWLVPFDAIDLPVTLPVDAKVDRVFLGGFALVWVLALAAGGVGSPRLRSSPLNIALLAFLLAAIVSVLVNVEGLVALEEYQLSFKSLALLAAYIAFFFLVSSVVRVSEVSPFVTLMLGLACLTALGTIIEYRTDTNPFFTIGGDIFPGTVPDRAGVDSFGRKQISGPSSHGFAASTMLASAMGFALIRLTGTRERRKKLMYAAMVALFFSGAMATVRKSGLVIPGIVVLVVLCYRPRQMARLAPLGVVLLVIVHLLAPGAMGSIRNQFDQGNTGPVEGRTEDYRAVSPDITAKPLVGRGYGAYDPNRYRFLDNQYLGLTITTGYVGVAAFVIVLVTIAGIAFRVARTGDPERAPPAVGVLGGTLAFAVSSLLFDSNAFPHAPYTLLFLAAMAVVLADPSEEPAGHRAASPPDRASSALGQPRGHDRAAPFT